MIVLIYHKPLQTS
ncbi:hypothetical protein BpHYR1_040794 [Brachionus plicatilis]|uniref:Uncharacterized protein n=1 Tax=Brachionus plicatilis TaxID=10195 RepID=A0A3M7T172_BRAPC|nr:hypothetical protein BpHYR1_040794 [Brachionus plicatilis]